MGNIIDAIVGKQATNELDSVIAKLEHAYEIQTKIQTAAQKNMNVGSVKTPGDLNARVGSNANLVTELKANNAEIQKQINLRSKLEAQIERERISQIKLAQAREKAVDSYTAKEAKAAAVLAKSQGLYSKIQQEVNALTTSYNNLAIKKQLGLKLSNLEEAELYSLTGRLNQYQSALLKTDAGIQKYTRNVGNYASGYNGLGNSINQLAREAPAFAVSLNTGFLALSNNLPILFDEIQRTKQGIAALKAEGKSAPSLFAQLAGSVFSLQTALSIAVLGLTLYGGKIINAISGSEDRKKALEAEKKALEDKTQEEKNATEQIGNTIAAETNRARILFDLAKNEKNTFEQRTKAIKELRDRYPEYLKGLSDEKILAGETAEAEERLNKALINRGKAIAAQAFLQENASKQFQAQLDYEKVAAKGFKEIDKLRNPDGSIKNQQKYAEVLRKTGLANAEAARALEARLKPLKEEEELLLSVFEENSRYLEIVKETTTSTTEAARADVESMSITEAKTVSLLDSLRKQIDMVKELQQANSKNKATYDEYQKTIDNLQRSIDAITEGYKELQESAARGIDQAEAENENNLRRIETWKALQKVTEDYIKTFSSGFFKDAGLSSLDQFIDGSLNKLIAGAVKINEVTGEITADITKQFAIAFAAISDVVKDAYSFINQEAENTYRNNLERLNSQYEIEKESAGDNAAAKIEIERQYEYQRRELEKKKAESDKQAKLFSALINTATAVTAFLADGNYAGAILAGIVGAAQIAIISNASVPNYEKGLDAGEHPGGALLINDGKGSNYQETIITPDGKMIQPKGRNVLTTAPKGSLVYTQDQFSDYVNSYVASQGILPSGLHMTTLPANDIDYNRMGAEFTKAVKSIPKGDSFHVIDDEKGRRIYQESNNAKIQLMNAKLSFKGNRG